MWSTTEADNQSSVHWVTVSTDVMSDHIGCRDASPDDDMRAGPSDSRRRTTDTDVAAGCARRAPVPDDPQFQEVSGRIEQTGRRVMHRAVEADRADCQ